MKDFFKMLLSNAGHYLSAIIIIFTSMVLAYATTDVMLIDDPLYFMAFLFGYLILFGIATGKLKRFKFKIGPIELENKGTAKYLREEEACKGTGDGTIKKDED